MEARATVTVVEKKSVRFSLLCGCTACTRNPTGVKGNATVIYWGFSYSKILTKFSSTQKNNIEFLSQIIWRTQRGNLERLSTNNYSVKPLTKKKLLYT